MGRDVAGLRIDKKSNMVDDNGTAPDPVHVAPKAVPEEAGKMDYELEKHNGKGRLDMDYELEKHNGKGRLDDECNEKQDVLVVKSTNHEPEEKIIKAEAQKSSDKKSTGSAVNGTTDENSCSNNANGPEDSESGLKVSSKSNEHSPKSAKKSQSNSHFISRKQLMPNCKSYYDEEDNWSMASSTATSVRTRITVPVAPRFTCTDRLERRKEFYTKLEEKHKALEKEKLEYEARTKEEEQAAIKQLRKNMVVKAKPVPSFYREGPPPKVELKKLPVTRAKSPNLSRRKSCGDAVKASPSPEDKALGGRTTRHSVGVYKEGKASSPLLRKTASPLAPKSKDQKTDARKLNGSNKPKSRPQQIRETTEKCYVKEQANADIAVES